MAIVAVVLLQLGFAFDSADGQLARLKGGGSPAGEWLDHVVDSARHLLFHLAVLIGVFRFTDVDEVVLIIPLAFGVVSSVRFFVVLLWPWTTVFLWAYGILGALNAVLLAATVVRRHRELDGLTA